MQYDPSTKRLETNAGDLIKVISCPLEKKWSQLMPFPERWDEPLKVDGGLEQNSVQDIRFFLAAQAEQEPEESEREAWLEWKERMRGKPADYLKKYCGSCRKCVVNANRFSEEQIIALVEVNPELCLHLSSEHPELAIKQSVASEDSRECGYEGITRQGLPIIQTARSLAAIEEGVRRGYRPLFVAADYKNGVGTKLWVSFRPEENTILYSGDFRSMVGPLEGTENGIASIIVRHDDDRHPSPLAAYMIPPDIRPGDRVYVADIIEEIVLKRWNQGDGWRRVSSDAVWTGEKLEIEHRDPIRMMG